MYEVGSMTLTHEQIEQRMNSLMEVCRRDHIKLTYQRMEIFREVASTDEHPDAETIYERVRKRIPTVSLDTVYRGVALLEKMGLVSRVHVLSDRTRFDANTRPHHHFVCSKCGLIRDFYCPEADGFTVPSEVASWGSVNFVRVELEGVCVKCGSRARTTE